MCHTKCSIAFHLVHQQNRKTIVGIYFSQSANLNVVWKWNELHEIDRSVFFLNIFVNFSVYCECAADFVRVA